MLDILNKDDYRADSVHKNLVIELEDGTTIDNVNIKSESMKLNEILMDSTQLQFGRCNSSQFSVTLADIASNIKGKTIKPYIVVGGNEINKTATGNDITINDSSRNLFIEFSAEGYTKQDGTPTPDEPIDIQCLADDGILTVTTTGKNLFSYEKSVSGYLTGGNTGGITSANATNKERTSEYINVENIKNVIFQVWATPTADSHIWWAYEMYDSNRNRTLNRVANHENALTGGTLRHFAQSIEIPEGTTYIRVSARLFDDGKIQVEAGTQATEYEPYQSTTANIPLDAPLYEGDYIEYANGSGKIVRNKASIVFNGSESWLLNRNEDNENTIQFRAVSSKGLKSGSALYADKLTFKTSSSDIECIRSTYRTNYEFIIGVNKSRLSELDINGFKTWLQSNPITVVYELATPTETPLTAEQIAEIEKLNTFESTTNVFTESNTTIKYRYNKALPLGVFTVKDVPRLSQTPYKQITALDNMHKIDRDVTEWYNNLKFPMKQKAFRDSFFSYIGLEQVETSLLFDNLIINNPLADIGQINGRTIAEGLCELNATFGHCDRQGRFSYVSLDYMSIFPSNNTVPDDDIVPNIPIYMSNPNGIIEDINNLYIKASYEEYETQFIDRIMAIDDYGYQLANNDYGTNTYVLNNNYLLYGRDKDELIDIMNGFMSVISTISYRPAEISCKGLPYLELGDRVSLDVQNNNNVTIYIFKRTLTGIQSLRDIYSADGEEYLINDLNSIQAKIDSLNRATDRLKIEVSQTSEGLKSKVSKGEVSTEISQEADEVRITGNRFVVDADNLSISADGSLVANNGKFKGTINADKGITMFDNEYGLEGIRIYPGIVDIGGFEPVTDSAVFLDGVKFFCLNTDYLMGSQAIFDKITINGTKSRQIETYNYGNRLEYCYEMPTPYFGDIGEGITDNEGICYIFIDDIFAETIDTNCEYQVFLQAYDEGTVYVNERNSSYFVVKGTPNMRFAWEIKAVQRDYEMYRLDESSQEVEETTDYAEESYDYLASLLYDVEQESEVIINE